VVKLSLDLQVGGGSRRWGGFEGKATWLRPGSKASVKCLLLPFPQKLCSTYHLPSRFMPVHAPFSCLANSCFRSQPKVTSPGKIGHSLFSAPTVMILFYEAEI
jgi:hypothetical protein